MKDHWCTPARRKVIATDYPAGWPIARIRERLIALPGLPVPGIKTITTYATSLMHLSRPEGFTGALSPDLLAELERLWVKTHIPAVEIADWVNARFGSALNGKKVEWHARRREWRRETMAASNNHRSMIEERLFTKAWNRWARPVVRDNPVRLVAPKTFPAEGFSMLGGRV